MGKTLTIAIANETIVKEVHKTLSYTGARTERKDGGNEYNHISTNEEDAEMMKRFWYEACAIVGRQGKEFVTQQKATSAEFTIAYGLPNNYNTAFDWSVKQMMTSFIVWYILGRWFEVCGMYDESKLYLTTAEMFLKEMKGYLYSRTTTSTAEGAEKSGNSFGSDVPQMFGKVEVEIYDPQTYEETC